LIGEIFGGVKREIWGGEFLLLTGTEVHGRIGEIPGIGNVDFVRSRGLCSACVGCEKRGLGEWNAGSGLSRAKEAAEELWIWGGNGEKHTSAAKADKFSVGIVPGTNPRPTARVSFPQPVKALWFIGVIGAGVSVS